MSRLLRRKRINPRSERRVLEQKKYLFLRARFLADNPECAVGLRGCQHYAADVHHMAQRGKNFLKVETWLPVCRFCHDWIHAHGAQAEAKGLKTRMP